MMDKKVSILGIRGIPASHGGFETFAENLAPFLVNKGWHVTVYCQEIGSGGIKTDIWCGVERVKIPVKYAGAIGTIVFDARSVLHASKTNNLILLLGYNTAIFSLIFRLKKITNIINMDGIEWKRNKWKWYEKIWLYVNERVACLVGNHLIADHPEIRSHLISRVACEKITVIPYGARKVVRPDVSRLDKYNVLPNQYAIVIARPEPENSILEIVRAFSSVKRNKKLVVLGTYNKDNKYHEMVKACASDEVLFLGPIYDHNDLDALRFYSLLYIHGHTVGGTNPSLVEALGAGQPVLAHDNKFNRWVVARGAVYFNGEKQCSEALNDLLNNEELLHQMSLANQQRFNEYFTWNHVLNQYEELLLSGQA